MSLNNFFRRLSSLFSFHSQSKEPNGWDGQTRRQLERLFGCGIHNFDLIQEAFRHASYPACSGDNPLPSNERMEFLGDAVLDLVVRERLYHGYPVKDEGVLTKMRSILASKPVLAQKARELDLCSYLLLSPGEEKTGGRKKDSILANTLEAVIGALYLDRGLEPTRKFIIKAFGDSWESLPREQRRRNFKGELLEHCQRLYKQAPSYRIVKQEGAEHRKRYTIEVRLKGKRLGIGRGYSKKKAEQRGAEKALMKLTEENFQSL